MLTTFCKIGKSKWLMLFLYCVMIIGNGIVSKAIVYSTNQLQSYINLSAKELQGIAVSATAVLSIPMSLFGAYMITVFGITETTFIFQVVSSLGWVIFANGVSNKSKLEMMAGRIIQGASFGPRRISVTTYCTCRFDNNNLAFAMGCIAMAIKLSMIIGR